MSGRLRTLALVLPDDLNRESPVLAALDPNRDMVWMAETGVERGLRPDGPKAHKRRVSLIISAMRHFAAELQGGGLRVTYHRLGGETPVDTAADQSSPSRSPFGGVQPPAARAPAGAAQTSEASQGRTGLPVQGQREADAFTLALSADLARLHPQRVVVTRPGDWELEYRLHAASTAAGASFEVLEDPHFLSGPAEFALFMEGRKTPLLEAFYRRRRRHLGVLMTDAGKPEGGAWNYDRANRKRFGTQGPEDVPEQPRFEHDEISREAIETVERLFPDHPGADAAFDLPVTPGEAEEALEDFITSRLPLFGDVQDAMWTGRPFLFHSRLSAALNLKLLHPLRPIRAAEEAYHRGAAPLNAVEGFIRQILGWREFVRGVYFHYMPEYAERNALAAHEALPGLYWTGETEMRCLREVVEGLVTHGYAHHIQRLLVTGLFALLYGAEPAEFNDWHLAMYIDAFDWVSAPNTIGMTLHADGGIVGTKPYAATGNYIHRMSNYCRNCRFDPRAASGDRACPITTLYWTFLGRHADRFRGNHRMLFQIKNLERKDSEEMKAIRSRADEVRNRVSDGRL